MKKVIIFGGAFNPIHQTHLEIARQASILLDVDVWFDVSEKPRWKSGYLGKKTRERLVKEAIRGEERFRLSEKIPSTGTVTYTIDTMLYLIDKYPNYKFYFLIGTDQVNLLDKWKDIDALKELVQFIYIDRPGYELNKENFKKYKIKDIGLVGSEISSTKVRAGDFKLCPKPVYDIICREGLYFKEILEGILSEHRFKHSLRVAKLAVQMAKANNIDVHKAYIAGIVHDCAKQLPKEETMELMNKHFPEHLNEAYAIYHQYLAPLLAEKYFGITDSEIFEAIQYHTTGKVGMSDLAKIIFCADKTEPGRDYDSTFLVDRCLENITTGFAFTMVEQIAFLQKIDHEVLINDDTKALYQEALKIKELYLLKLVVKTIDDHFGRDITIIDVSTSNPLVKYYVNCDALSERQVRALAETVADVVCEYQYPLHHIEGRNNPEWVLVDAIDVVVNIFKTEARGNYHLEKLMADADIYSFEEVMEMEY